MALNACLKAMVGFYCNQLRGFKQDNATREDASRKKGKCLNFLLNLF